MNILLKYIISILLFGLIIKNSSIAQSRSYFGLELSNSINYNFRPNNGGYVIEPIFIYKPTDKNIRYKTVLGYASLVSNPVLRNSNIETRGIYLKEGIGYPLNKTVIPNVHLVATSYIIDNRFELIGEYFGNYEETYNHNNLFALAIEPSLDIKIKIYNKISVLLSTYISIVLVNTEKSDFPVYFIPGVGIVNTRSVTTGINIYIMLY